MNLKPLIAAAALAALLGSAAALAQNVFIPASNRIDVAHDAARDLVYISAGDRVLRYHLTSGAFLAPIMLGGNLRGIDISPSGDVLAVANESSSADSVWIHLVDLDSLDAVAVQASKGFNETGTYSVSFAADGSLYTSSTYGGSGWVPFRRLSADDLSWSSLAEVRMRTMLSSSGDGRIVAFAEASSSDGPWGLFDTQTGELVRRQGYQNGTSAFNYEIAANRDGSQVAIPTYSGTRIYDGAYQHIATLGVYAGPQPIGIAYHPVEPLIYAPWRDSQEVRVFSATDFSQVAAFAVGYTFPSNGNWAYQHGRTRLSRDGSLLMVTVGGGVRAIRQYPALAAQDIAAEAVSGAAVHVVLQGSIGNGGALGYEIVQVPNHGAVSLDGDVATYTAPAGFAGIDRFRYRVVYGRASAEASVDLILTASNQAPVAGDDIAYARNHPIKIDVLANDSDADGDPLTITSVTQPRLGTVDILDGLVLIFTPPRPFQGETEFSYTISDANGGTATAVVRVRRN